MGVHAVKMGDRWHSQRVEPKDGDPHRLDGLGLEVATPRRRLGRVEMMGIGGVGLPTDEEHLQGRVQKPAQRTPRRREA